MLHNCLPSGTCFLCICQENINILLYDFHHLPNHYFLLFLFSITSPLSIRNETGFRKKKENPVLYHHLGSVMASAVLIYTKIHDPGA